MNAEIACVVCGTPGGDPIYANDGSSSLTSGARIVRVTTVVRVCQTCAHIQTEPLANIDAYYDLEYNANLESETADDLYTVRDGKSIYRSEHQAAVALDKLALPPNARVLDYGSAKAATPRRMLQARPDLRLALFDVSDNYREYWSEFVDEADQASFELPSAWDGRFDAVTSFFALEHVADPGPFLARIRRLLAPGGQVHIVVPNVCENVGDFVVVDHVNHFTPSSLHFALEAAGFTDLRIDESAHAASYVVDARRTEAPVPPKPDPRTSEYVAEAQRLAANWYQAVVKIQSFERQQVPGSRAAIYGSGFYGAFIVNSLRDRSSVAYFIDRNPHQQAKRVFDLPVIAPEDIGDDIDVLYAGLNPARAKEILASVSAIQRRDRTVFLWEEI